MKDKIRKNYKKIVLCIIIVLAIASVVHVGVQSIQKVLDVKTKTYYVTERRMETVFTKKNYEKEFLCVGKEMEQIQVEAIATELTTGTVFYKITDINQKVLVEQKSEIVELLDADLKGLYIDVSQIGLVQGERYVMSVDFAEADGLQVTLGDDNLSLRQYFKFAYKMQYIVAIVTCMIIVTAWLFWSQKRELSGKVFLATLLFVGVFVSVVMPPANRDDEYRHFIRAYTGAVDYAYIEKEEADGTENGMISANGPVAHVPHVINEIRLMDYEGNSNGYGYVQELNFGLCVDKLLATIKASPIEQECQVGAEATADRGNVYYWPQVFAIKIASLLGVGDLFMHYIARFGQVLVCALMGALAIMIAPKLKVIIWLLAFVPNILLLTASCNCDGLLIWEIILLVAVAVWLKEQKIPLLSKKGAIGIIAYTVLTYSIVSMKVPYALVCIGALVYLGKDNFPKIVGFIKRQNKNTIILSSIVLSVMLLVAMILSKGILIRALYSFVDKEYVDYILQNKRAIYDLFTGKWIEMMKQLYVAMDGYNVVPYPIMIIGICLLAKKNQPIIKKVWFVALFAVMVMVIVLVGYTLTPPDYGVIWGITFRYILPFVILATLSLPMGNDVTDRIAKRLVPISVYMTTGATMLAWLVEWSV